MRQGGATADGRKTSTDYGEWAGETASTSGQQGVPMRRRSEAFRTNKMNTLELLAIY